MLVKQMKVVWEVGIDNEPGGAAEQHPYQRTPFKTSFGPGDGHDPEHRGHDEQHKQVVRPTEYKRQWQEWPVFSAKEQKKGKEQEKKHGQERCGHVLSEQ